MSDLLAGRTVLVVGGSSGMSGGFLETSPDTMRHVIASEFATNWAIARLVAGKIRDGGSMTFTAGTGGGVSLT